MRRLLRRVLLGAAAGALATACISPTLPLPPPAVPDAENVGQGQYRLTGTIPVPGTVLVMNTRTNLVYGEDTPGQYDFLVGAKPCDDMVVWYQTGTDQSTTVGFFIGSQLPDRCQLPRDAGAPVSTADAGADAAP